MEVLANEFPDYEERIERLSEYMASTGKSYKNLGHYTELGKERCEKRKSV